MDTIKFIIDPATNKFIFVDGDTVFAPEMRFGPTAQGPWETVFDPHEHNSQANNQVRMAGHEYFILRVNELAEWQTPGKIVGTDGKNVTIYIDQTTLFQKTEGEEPVALLDLSTLKGETGPQGIQGHGIHIGAYMYYDEMLLTTGTATTNCIPCGKTSPVGGALPTVLVLGDNKLHPIVAADWAGTQYHKVALTDTVWTPTTALHLDLKVAVYGYDGADPATVKYATADNIPRTGFSEGVSGTVWAYVDTTWVNIGSITAPDYRLAPNDANPTLGKFADGYVQASNTLTLTDAFTFEVGDATLLPKHISTTTFGHGFYHPGNLTIKIDPEQLIGLGIGFHNSTASGEKVFHLDLRGLTEDGLQLIQGADIDGAPNWIASVKPEDLVAENEHAYVEGTDSGEGGAIGTYTSSVDGKKNYFVKVRGVLKRLADRLGLTADEKTITALDSSEELLVPVSDDAVDGTGIQGKHIHNNAYDNARGLFKDPASKKAFLAISDMLKFNAETGALEINVDGVRQYALHPDTVDEDYALTITDGQIRLKVDEHVFKFNASTGVLEFITLTGDNFADNQIVKTLMVGAQGTFTPDIMKDIVKLDISVDSFLRVSVATTMGVNTDTAAWTITVDSADFAAAVNAVIAAYNFSAPQDPYWRNLEYSAAEPYSISSKLLTKVPYNTWIGDVYVSNGIVTGDNPSWTSTAGWFVRQAGTTDTALAKKITLDVNGNLSAV